MRNWFLDTGFILKDGTLINVEPVRALVDATSSEISSCHKLKSTHVTCEKTQRQNVRLAAEVFSNTTATALKRYLPGSNKILARDVGEFIELVNNWFDIMNSYTPSAVVPTKRPFGLNMIQQNATLEDMKATISHMTCCGKKSLQTFQRGIVMLIHCKVCSSTSRKP